MNLLSDFVNHIKKNSIARSNRFRIQFNIPEVVSAMATMVDYSGSVDIPKTMSLTCLMTDIPGQTTQSNTINYGNYDRKVVNGRTTGDFTTSFLVTGKYIEKKLFDLWSVAMNDENNHAVEFYDSYITTIYLECLNEQDEVTYRAEITEAYPSSISNLKLDRTAQNSQMVLDVSWAYHRCVPVVNNVGKMPPDSNYNTAITGQPSLNTFNSGKQKMPLIPGISQMSAALQSAAALGTEFRGQLQGVLNIANTVREEVRDLKMSSVNGVKILNGVVKDVKAIKNIPNDVKNEVVAVVTDTRNQIGYIKNDIANISNYPKR